MKTMKKTRKRKIRYIRLLLVMLVLVVGTGIPVTLYAAKEKEKRTLAVEEILQEREQYEKMISEQVCPDHVPQDVFDSLQAEALSYGKEEYEAIADVDDITKDVYEKAVAVKEKHADMESVYQQVMENMPLYDEPAYFVFLSRKDDHEDRLRFMAKFDEKDTMTKSPDTLTESLEEVPLLLQWDDRWGYVPYGDWYIGFAGCGPTSIAMTASYLKQDPSITPTAVAKRAMELDQYEPGAGTKWTFYSVMADDYQLHHTQKYDPTAQDIISSLQAGNLIILSVTPGDFTATGHFIVLTGLDDTGQVIIHDPNSKTNSSKTWDPETLAAQAACMWSFSN